jgi:leucyl-tRNA synthetase
VGAEWASIHTQSWPEVDVRAATAATREVPVQVNGKLRDKVEVPTGIGQADLEALVLGRSKVAAALNGRHPDRIIHAGGGRLVNIVVRD